MTLIDIDPLKERINKEVKEGKVLDGWAFFIKAYLDSEPHIDIVQCKECKYERDGEEFMWCEHPRGLDSIVKPDDYCSYGEREGE